MAQATTTDLTGRRRPSQPTATADEREGARTVERMLQINMALLISLGTLVLSMGQNKTVMPVLVALAAGASVYLVDWKNKFRLNRDLANTMALVAVAIAAWNFFGNTAENRILAIANLLVYLQVVLLFQRKNYRVYGHLAVLSLLQVVVASALNLGFVFGVMLVIYMFVSLGVLWLMFVYRELHGRTDPPLPFSQKSSSETPPETVPPAEHRGGQLHRWPLARQPARFAPCLGANAARRMLSGRMIYQFAWMGAGTLLLTIAVFFALPRWSKDVWQGPRGAIKVTGFDEKIEFAQHSEIVERDSIALRVTFYDQTDTAIQVPGEPYFRGRVLNMYTLSSDDKPARWSGSYEPISQSGWLRPVPAAEDREIVVRQEIVLSPQKTPVLFGAFPAYETNATSSEVVLDSHGLQLLRNTWDGAVPREQYRYEIATDAFADGQQDGLLRQDKPLSSWIRLEQRLLTLRSHERERVPILIDTAERIVTAAGAAPDDKWAAAQALETHFLTDSRYTYSLDRPARTVPDIDPNEDFIANNPVGHCEYFASALALMLRSQDIPARMVVGYKGGEYNSVGHYYLVRELHAHAWVEAYFSAEQLAGLPEAERLEGAAGAWIRFDPTPGGEDDLSGTTDIYVLALLHQWGDYLQILWDDHVLGLNSQRQREAIYQPVAAMVRKSLSALFSPESWRVALSGTARSLGVDPQGFLEGRWFNWRAGLVAMAICLLLVGIWRALRPPLLRLRRFLARQAREQRLRTQRRVPFYEQAEALLARHGWHRQPGQTQREFAVATDHRLAGCLPEGNWRGTLDQIVDAYYRVRFGGSHLEVREVHDLESALGRLDAALKQRRAEL